jgi:nucleotidyltransferase/DNA polymerase involved in DNA repair
MLITPAASDIPSRVFSAALPMFQTPYNARSSHQLVFVKPDFRKYEAASAATREVFRLYDPHFEAGSLDEAYLDVTDYCAQHGMTGEQVRLCRAVVL